MSEKDTDLMSHLLQPHQVVEAERMCAGHLDLVLATRRSARIAIVGTTIVLIFSFEYSDVLKLKIVNAPQDGKLEEPLHSFVWHCAAKAILAVRRGHDEASERKRAERDKAQS